MDTSQNGDDLTNMYMLYIYIIHLLKLRVTVLLNAWFSQVWLSPVQVLHMTNQRQRKSSSWNPTPLSLSAPPARWAARAVSSALSWQTWPSPWTDWRATPQGGPSTKVEVEKLHGMEMWKGSWRDPEEDILQRRGDKGREDGMKRRMSQKEDGRKGNQDGEKGKVREGGKEGRFRRRRAAWLLDSMTTCHQTLCHTRGGPTPNLTIRWPASTPSRTRNSEVPNRS